MTIYYQLPLPTLTFIGLLCRKTMNEERFIPGIYNYCDRWCERCPMTLRCRLYADEQEENAQHPESQDMANEAFWQRISHRLTQTLSLLREVAQEYDIDLDQLPEEADVLLEQGRLDADSAESVQAAQTYRRLADTWLNENLPSIREALDYEVSLALTSSAEQAQAVGEAVEVIQWYLHQIEVKLRRAYHSKTRLEGDEDEEEAEYINEAINGSAKVALIGIERSLAAWKVLYDHLSEHQDDILEHLVRLESTRQLTLHEFPEAPGFIRPGFDDRPS